MKVADRIIGIGEVTDKDLLKELIEKHARNEISDKSLNNISQEEFFKLELSSSLGV